MRFRASILLSFAALGIAACDVAPPASTPPPPAKLAPRPKAWKWANEEQWMISEIAGSIGALTTMARHPANVSAEDFAVRIVSVNEKQGSGASLQPLEARLVIGRDTPEQRLVAHDYLFSPRSWAPVAAALVPHREPGLAARLLPDDKLLETLLDLRATVLERENQRVSNALVQDSSDPVANEQAALVLGAFSLREAAGSLSDTRPAMARMTAHLALARAVVGPREPGLAGSYAEITLLSLAQRQRDAIDAIEGLERGNPSSAQRSWLRALRLRNTGDWRVMPETRGASLLERLERFRARRHRLSIDATNPELRKEAAEPVADWGRLTLFGEQNVEACGVFGSSLVSQNMQEALAVLHLGRSAPPNSPVDLVKTLKESRDEGGFEMEGGRPYFMVIDRGLWGRFFERHLVHALAAEYACLQWMYGFKEEAVAYAGRARETFSGLPSLRLIARDLIHDTKDPERGFREAIGLLEREPQRVTAAAWTELRQDKHYPTLLSTMPDESLWFSTGFLRGTTYDADNRLHHLKTLRVVRLEDKAAFRNLAPYDYWVVWAYIWKLGEERPVLDIVVREAPELMKYDARLLRSVLRTWPDNVPLQKTLGRHLCELDPGEWPAFGERLVALGDEAGALDAFRQMIAKTPDEVALTNGLEWLVDYEFEHGRKDEALRLARRAAATGSGTGYWLLGRQLELRGDLMGAFANMRAVQERYNYRTAMVALYIRHRDAFRGSPVQAHVEPVLAEIFPTGLESVSLAQLVGAPRDGVLFKDTSDRLKATGLEPGSVLVSVNGRRVRNKEQYYCLRWADMDPHLQLVAWQGGRYFETHSTFKDRDLNVAIENYKP